MKRLKGFVIFLYIFFTVLVVILHPAMHKPVTLENTNFKIKDQLMNPKPRKVSDFELKVKFYRTNKTVAKAEDKTIHIKPDDDKTLSFDLTQDTRTQEAVLDTSENSSTELQKDLEMEFSDSKMLYQDREINISDQQAKYSEQNLNLDENIPRSDLDIGLIDQNDNVKLKDSDEVGNRKFKGSREEIIAWNVWRSELQNRIMDESAIEAPVGTLILFSFDVSENGRISNLKYTCTNRQYAADAKADMISILKRLQGDSILDFPPNTQRKNVRFKGGFILDYDTVYSKPSDYSDYERIRS
ncbi:hypothetical protein DBY21_09865 [Candidatus Gastranaerophilales bacterium]|nr:MAG: hypothetical protein DBY21_09865 [Candidatus Gastranaerophilales bacterium]